jgi:hypothetical protein
MGEGARQDRPTCCSSSEESGPHLHAADPPPSSPWHGAATPPNTATPCMHVCATTPDPPKNNKKAHLRPERPLVQVERLGELARLTRVVIRPRARVLGRQVVYHLLPAHAAAQGQRAGARCVGLWPASRKAGNAAAPALAPAGCCLLAAHTPGRPSPSTVAGEATTSPPPPPKPDPPKGGRQLALGPADQRACLLGRLVSLLGAGPHPLGQHGCLERALRVLHRHAERAAARPALSARTLLLGHQGGAARSAAPSARLQGHAAVAAALHSHTPTRSPPNARPTCSS